MEQEVTGGTASLNPGLPYGLPPGTVGKLSLREGKELVQAKPISTPRELDTGSDCKQVWVRVVGSIGPALPGSPEKQAFSSVGKRCSIAATKLKQSAMPTTHPCPSTDQALH